MNKLKVTIVGGDLRFVRLAEILSNKGFDVSTFGLCHPDLPKEVHQLVSFEEVKDSPYIIGPIPFSRDGKNVFTPMCNCNVSIEEFMLNAKNSFVLGSVLKPAIRKEFEKFGIGYVDIFDMDEIAILNGIPTAEGAIQVAMENSEITLHNSKCLVLGYGRCGKLLSTKLHALGAIVSVEARNTKDLSFISTYGCRPISLYDLKPYLHEFDFIFNTIPVKFLDKSFIDEFNPNVVYIEIASTPGGIDVDYCEQKDIRYINAPSLPGKVAPTTAADILYQCLSIILKNQGVTI